MIKRRLSNVRDYASLVLLRKPQLRLGSTIQSAGEAILTRRAAPYHPLAGSRPPADALPVLFGSRKHGLSDLGFIDGHGGVNLDEGSNAKGRHGPPP